MKNILWALVILVSFSAQTQTQTKTDANSENKNLIKQDDNAPTYLSANTLFVDNQKHTFRYSGNVSVKRGELRITSKTLDGSYNDKNEIQEMIARGDVYITSSGGISASSQQATYTAKTEVMVLTLSPELQQNGSILTADLIRIYVNENRSEAAGEVRVRMPQESKP